MSARFDMHRAITKAILETIGTDFLLLDGSREMTGTFLGQNVHPKADNTYYLGGAYPYRWKGATIGAINFTNLIGSLATITNLTSANVATGTVNFRTQYGGASDVAKILTTASGVGEFQIMRGGDIVSLAGKSLDAYTNAGYVKIRRLSQSEQPTPEVGEILLWRDTDNDETYLMYEDVDVGTRKVQLT